MSEPLRRRNAANAEPRSDADPKTTSKKNYNDPVTYACVVFRIVTGTIYVFSTIWLLWVVLPLRPLNPIFRKFGLKNDSLPTDVFPRLWGRVFVCIMGYTVSTEGLENIPKGESLVFMYSHASNLDPFLLVGWTPVAVKFLFKKSLLYWAPHIFPLAYLYGHIPIDRTDREKAIASLEQAGHHIRKYKRSIAIAPEGTRSQTGELLEFKKGPFHLCKKSGVPILPVVIFNNYELWPKGHLFPLSGEVRLKYLPQIVPKAEESIDELSDRVRAVMLDTLKHKPEIKDTAENILPALIFWIVWAISVYFGVIPLLSYLRHLLF